MNATKNEMKTWDVFCTENRAGGRTDHVGTVQARDEEEALIEAHGQNECRKTSHLWVSIAG